MAGSLGKAYVQIVPSAEGIKSALEEVLGGPLKNTGIKAGKSLSSTVGSGFKHIGSGMTNFITKPALAAVAALGGATLFSGWKRMTEIDSAKVKLEAIGNTAKDMEKITSSALESVKGTAYGMNEAMTASASAVAAGIQPGKDLTKYLTAISDAAAVAGVDMTSMGSIFNKVATSGKAHNDVLGQMADAGIPIYQYLADQLGVSAEKVFELASAGEIGLSDFQEAVTTHIGGAAREIGSKTITGAISNVRAAISRIGANFLGSADDADSFAGKVLPMLNSLMENLEPIEEKAKELGSQFADGFQKFADVISSIPLPVLGGIAGALVTIGPVLKMIGGIMTVIGPATSAITAILGGPLAGAVMTVAGCIAGLAAAFALIYASSESFRNAVNGLVQQLAPVFVPVLQAVFECMKTLVTEVMSVANAVGNALAPAIEVLTPVFMVLARLLSARLQFAFKALSAVIKSVANAVKVMAFLLQAAFMSIKSVVDKVWPPIKKVCENIKTAFKFGGLAGVVKAVFNSIKEAMRGPVDKAADLIRGIINRIKGFFHFSVSMPHIPLPHFSISPAGWNVGQLIKGKIPSLSVRWYREAMDEPYMFSKPTLFGAGEAGDEIMYGRQNLMADIRDAVGREGTTITNYFTINESDRAEEVAAEVIYRIRRELAIAR